MDRLIEGLEQITILLTCPHCQAEEYYPTYIQPQSFECVHVSPGGTIHAWLCRKCQKHFYTKNE
ncbi:hypothetical protein HZA73_09480 [candidate division TA06 bacterium]|nr:hypothetical protein [candidate division TA06 bacterium]